MTLSPERRHEVGAFFAANADRLRRVVASRINAPRALVDDACANAWTILLRHPEVRLADGGFSWLATVASNEALRLLRPGRHERPAGVFLPPAGDEEASGEIPEPPADTRDVADLVADRVEHAERLAALHELKPREREALFLSGAGYSYNDVAELTGASYAAVNRRITEGRARLRKLASERRTEASKATADESGLAEGGEPAPDPA